MVNRDQKNRLENIELLEENIFIEDINEWDKFCDDMEG